MFRVSQFSLILLLGLIVGIKSKPEDQCLGKCPAENPDNDVTYLPHEDCTKFCKCVFGSAHVESCPDGLHFNPKLRVCDYPDEAGCEEEHLVPIPPSFSRSVRMQMFLTFDDTLGCKGSCPTRRGDKVVHLAHKDCTKFCKCDFGIPFVFQCPTGLHFNPKLEVCDRPSHAGCEHKDPILILPELSYPKISLSKEKTTVIDDTDDTSGCKGNCPTWEGDTVVHLAHKDCTKFCKCDFGIPHVFTCPSGLHFNPKLAVCDRPSHAGCAPKP